MQQSGSIEADNSIIMIKLNDPNHTYNIMSVLLVEETGVPGENH
jgi:hypothetical protein